MYYFYNVVIVYKFYVNKQHYDCIVPLNQTKLEWFLRIKLEEPNASDKPVVSVISMNASKYNIIALLETCTKTK